MANLIEYLKNTLVKLRLPNHIEFTAILSLSSMPNLKHLWFRQHEVPNKLSETEKGALKSYFPKVLINQGFLEIANPEELKNPMNGFWDIECKQTLFNYPYIGYPELLPK